MLAIVRTICNGEIFLDRSAVILVFFLTDYPANAKRVVRNFLRFVVIVRAPVRTSFRMRWTLSAGMVALAVLLFLFTLLPSPGEAGRSSELNKRPRIDLRTWLKNIYPQIAEDEEIVQPVGGITGTGAPDKRIRDEDYGHLR